MTTDREELKRKLAEAGLGNIAQQIAQLARPCYRIMRTMKPDDEIPIGASKFGGSPDVPSDFAWPMSNNVPLAFVAQINLKDLSGDPLPKSGTLSFFYRPDQQAWGFDPKDAGAARVFLFAHGDLRRTPYPKAKRGWLGALKEYIRGEFSGYKPVAISFAPTLSVPASSCDSVRDLNLSDELGDLYGDWHGKMFEGPRHQLLGLPDPVQNEMELECQLVTNGIYCGDSDGYHSARAKELEAGAKDWVLLLQVDSDDDMDLMWGDVGMIYFWIRQQDLAVHNFDRVWLIFQCH